MTTSHVTADDFFTQLEKMFTSRHESDRGSVFLTQKRLTPSDASSATGKGQDSLADLDTETPFPILVRASNGDSKSSLAKKVKVSTVVQPDQLEAFYLRYAGVCKSGMQGLKKRDRSARKKATKAKKKIET